MGFNDNINLYSIYSSIEFSIEFLKELFSRDAQKSLFLIKFYLSDSCGTCLSNIISNKLYTHLIVKK